MLQRVPIFGLLFSAVIGVGAITFDAMQSSDFGNLPDYQKRLTWGGWGPAGWCCKDYEFCLPQRLCEGEVVGNAMGQCFSQLPSSHGEVPLGGPVNTEVCTTKSPGDINCQDGLNYVCFTAYVCRTNEVTGECEKSPLTANDIIIGESCTDNPLICGS